MSPIGSIGSGQMLPPLRQIESPLAPRTDGLASSPSSTPSTGFGKLLDNLVSSVDAKQAEANQVTQSVLLGDSGQLHQSVIAMQEASLSLGLMVEVRNKLVESYQELMRMQA